MRARASSVEAGFLERKARQVRARARLAPAVPDALRVEAARLPAPPSFAEVLRGGDRVALIAEFKRRSPSAGALSAEAPTTSTALYRDAGAGALSVVTDAEHFGGSLADLEAAAAATALPTLRKDFIVDARAILEARVAGAAAVLLIVAMLDDGELRALLREAGEARLAALVEVHDAPELSRALDAGATVIGINNRDLSSLVVDLATTERLAPLVPRGVVVVSESGIRDARNVARVRDAGAHAVLVGEALLRLRGDARAALAAELSGVSR